MSNDLIQRLRDAKIPHAVIARTLGRAQPAATRLLNGQRRLQADEVPKLEALYESYIGTGRRAPEPSSSKSITQTLSYVHVPVLPTFAGMGGGGTGDLTDEEEEALVPRYLVEGVLRGRPKDFMLVRVRGDSMDPDFCHDDELLIDLRDKQPTQPGPFALWHDDAYVVKNVERLPGGQVRIFSSNPKYTSIDLPHDTTRIIGRPVWFGRRL